MAMVIDPSKLDWLAQNFDPTPLPAEFDRIAQMGSNFMTMQGGTPGAPAPGTAGPMTGGGGMPAPGHDFASIVAGESGGIPTAAQPGPGPLPAGFLQQAMQQPQVRAPAAPAAAPRKGTAPKLPTPTRPNPVMDLGSILFGKRGF